MYYIVHGVAKSGTWLSDFHWYYSWGFPDGASGKESTCQCRRWKRHRFNLCVVKIPWRRAWPTTLVFLCGESHWQISWQAIVHRVTKSQTRLSDFTFTFFLYIDLSFKLLSVYLDDTLKLLYFGIKELYMCMYIHIYTHILLCKMHLNEKNREILWDPSVSFP